MSPRAHPDVEVDDVQAMALSSYAELGHSAYLPLRAEPDATLAPWLAGAAPAVTMGKPDRTRIQHAANVAFSHRGLRAFGLEPRALDEFSVPFREGMTGSPHRSRALGDVEDCDPELWAWGKATVPVDVLVALYARDATALAALVQKALAHATRHRLGLACPALPLSAWPTKAGVEGNREHFGFVDGISQPSIPLHATDDIDPADMRFVAAGELLLGYPNEAGTLPLGPTVPATRAAVDAGLAVAADGVRRDLGRNGTYLVFRQIDQDVHAFWEFARHHADLVGSTELCAAKLMGRWPNGMPLTLEPTRPGDPHGAVNENEFLFRDHDDEHGARCPIGSHVRRANPRDTLPQVGARFSLASIQRHRILRRARPYGRPIEGWPDPAAILARSPNGAAGERGLHFICLNADIAQQFEHLQQRWMNDPTFVNDPNDEVDPVLGRTRATTRFLIPQQPSAVLLGEHGRPCRRFVTVRGGEYFFLPSRRALAYLASARARS